MPTLPTISPELIKKYQEEIAKNSSNATAKRKTASLNKFFGWAEDKGHIDVNPLSQIQETNVVKTSNSNYKAYTILGVTGALIILIFLLTWKLGSPINYIKNLAGSVNDNPTAQVIIDNQNVLPSASPSSSISANSAENKIWNLYANLKLTNPDGTPRVGSETLTFKIYNTENGGSAVYTSEPQSVTTDNNGSALISLDTVPQDLFFQNNKLFLETEIASSSASARIPVSTANVAANIGGYFPANPDTGADAFSVPIIDANGSLNLASQSPAINAKAGNLLVQGQAVTIKTADGGNGNIEINPDGSGIAHFLFEGSKGNFLNAQAPNLNSGSLYYGIVANNSTGYDLLKLQNGSKAITRFSVDALGNTIASGDINAGGNLQTSGVSRVTSTGGLQNITGYSQNSGNFVINQNPGDFASITKVGQALNNAVTLTLDERNQTTNTSYSTLVLNRYNAYGTGMALLVANGNAQFDGIVKLGNYATNPGNIGTGSLVYNTTDNKVYVWNGTIWEAVGTGGSASSAFNDITSGTNTTAAMVVGSGASLNYSGSGTINASSLNGLSSSQFFRSDTSGGTTGQILTSGGGAAPTWQNITSSLTAGTDISITGTTNATINDISTLNSVTGRGATTTNAITVGNLTDSGLTASKGVFTDAAKQLTSTGTLGVDQGGTGLTSYAVGDLLYADTTASLAKLADVVTGNVLISGGVNTAPSYGKVVLGTHTTGNYVSSLTGTANQITASGSTGDITLSIPSDFRAPGTVNATTGLYTGATAGTQRIDASGNLTNIGTTQLHGVTYTWPAAIAANNYVLQTQTDGTLAWVDPTTSIASSIHWNQADGAVYPKNNSVDLLIGADSTASAKFAFTGVNGGTPNILINNSSVLNATTLGSGVTNSSLTSVGALASGSIANGFGTITTGNTITGTVINGTTGVNTGAVAGTQRIDASGNLTNIGTTQLHGITYTWPAADGGSGQVLSTNGTGGLSWTSALTDSSVFWAQSAVNGVLYPKNNSVDVLIGSDATTSAKFGFTGVKSGTPTATISGTTANVATYLDGNGNLGTTNASDLTLGSSTTGNVIINSRGNAALTANGANLTAGGTVTLPNSNTLTGVANYLQLNNGLSVGGGTTYYFNTSGNINAAGITGTSITDSGLSNNKVVFTDGSKTLTSSGTVGVDQGGTGFTTYAVGDLLYADTTATLARLADVVTGNVLISGGVNTAPSYGKVVLGTHTTGNYVSSLTGTANQITASGSTGDITLSIPSDFRAPGTVNATTGLYTGATAGTQRIDASGNLTNIGTTQLHGVTYTWPAAIAANNYVLQTQTDGTLAWVDPTAAIASSIFWNQANGAVYPKNSSVDLLVGADSTTSAKFAVTGVNGGTPTATIAGTTANVATYLTGEGNLAVTNMANLTLGGATTSKVVASSPFSAGSITDTGLNVTKGVFTDANRQLTSTGTLGADQGGTGFSTYAVGDLLYADTTATLARLADVVTGNVLISGGVNTAPSYGKVVLGTHTTGNYVSSLTGTANQITASGSTGDITLSIPSDFRAPGTVNATTGLYTGATAGTQRIDASGNLTNIGTTQLHGVTYTWPAADAGSSGYVLSSNAGGTLSWTDPGTAVASTIYWSQALGSVFPKNNTVDLLVGSDSTTSAKFAFTGVDGGLPTASIAGSIANVATYLTGNGTLATTNMQPLTLGGATTSIINGNNSLNLTTGNDYQINGTSVLSANTLGSGVTNSSLTSVGALASGSIANGFGTITTGNTITGTVINGTTGVNTGAVAGTQRIDASGNLTNIGTTQLHGLTYTWPASIAANNYVLQTQTDGTLAWVDPNSAVASTIFWNQANGVIYPKNNSVDLLVGSDSTTSAKFAFTGVDGGLPTASIAGSIANVATYLTGNGNLATTNARDLTLGGTTTGNVIINSRGNAALTANGANLTTTGTLTFPNSNTITGVSDYLQFNNGLAVGASNVYRFDKNGNINAAGITGTSITDSGLSNNKVVFTDGSKTLTSSGTVGVDQGGTGFTTYAVGDLLYADTTATLARLADVVAGNVLISGGVNTAPSWGKVVLGTHTTGNYVSSLAGTANQITASGSTGDITLSIPSDFRAPGTVNATTGLYTGATAGTQRIDASGNLTNIGTTQLHGVTYTWPAADAGASGYVLSSNAAGALSWVAQTGGAGGTWTLDEANGVIYPNSQIVDVLMGGTATTSAKFAFTGIGSGTPTASIAGTTANVATFIDGNGNISSTNRNNLVLGNSATYDSTGNILLNPNGTGKVGIGTASPIALLDVAGTASVSGTLTIGNGSAIQSAYGPLTLNYKSGADAWSAGLSLTNSGYVGIGTTTPSALFSVGSSSQFQVDASGNILGSGTTGLTLSGAAAGITFSGANTHAISVSTAATNLTIDAGTTGTVSIGGSSTGDILLAGGAGATGCTITNSNGDLNCNGVLQAAGTSTTLYSRFGTAATNHGFTSAQDVLVGGNMELDGILYLDGRMIANPNGTASLILAADPAAADSPNILDNGVWFINNNVNNGMAALMINQDRGGDIFTASSSGNTQFTIHKDSSFTMTGTANAPTSYTTPGTIYFDTDVKAVNGTTTGDLFIRGEDNAWHRVSLDQTYYASSAANIVNGSYIEIAHNQNTNDINFTAWIKDSITGLWRKITDVTSTIVHNLDNLFNPSYAQKTKVNSVALALSENTGDGADGAITVSANTNINTTPIAAGRSCADAINYSVTALTSTAATVTPTPTSACLAAGDEVLLINLQGTNSAFGNVGNYEFLEVSSISGDTVTFKTSKTKYYGDNTSDDTNLGTAYGTQRVMLQRVPNYTTVSVASGYSLYPSAWNGAKGGVIAFRATGEVSIVGTLQATSTAGGGYAGGAGASVSLNGGFGGEAFCGSGGVGNSPGNGGAGAAGGGSYYSGAYVGGPAYCGGGGGGATTVGTGSASAGGAGGAGSGYMGAGGGGGYGTAGTGGGGASAGANGGTNSSGNGGAAGSAAGGGGGGSFGTTDLSKMYFGSAGGGAGLHSSYPPSGSGGAGGGIIYVSANTLNVSGLISASGSSGTNGNASAGGGGGGGAGGSIKLVANTLSLGTDKVQAAAGSGGTGTYRGGAGGTGRIATYSNISSGSIGATYGVYNAYGISYFPYSVYVSKEIHTPLTTAFNNISWTENLDTNGLVSVQTRSGNSADATDGTWEGWKPVTTDTNIKVLQTADTHTDWTGIADSTILTKYDNTTPSNSDTSSTNGRIPLGTGSKGDSVQALPRAIIKDGSTYKMWYTGTGGSSYNIYYATSSDGLTWTKYDNSVPSASDTTSTNGRVPLGTNGKGDDTHAGFASVILDGSTYKMWYSGHDGSYWYIYYATSSDGLVWTKYDNSTPGATCDSTGGACNTNGRIFLGSSGKGDDGAAYAPTVIKDGSTYKMWYIGSHSGNERVFYATSSDGLSWTKYDNTYEAASDTTGTNGRVPLGTNGTGDDTWASAPSVVLDGSTYRMWYVGHDGATFRIYQATSSDGLTWTKSNNAIPSNSDSSSTNGKIPLGTAGKGDATNAGYQAVLKDGADYKIWYGGNDSGSTYRAYYAYSTATVADGDITRNVNEYEDEDEATAGNITKLTATQNGYAEATIASTDISSYDMISAWVYSRTAGSVIKLGFGEAAGNEQEETVTIDAINTWQKVYWNIKDIASGSRDGVTKLRVTSTSASNVIYIDNIKAEKLLTTAAGSAITSTANNYIQYRAILTTTNILNKPTASGFTINLTNPNGTYNVDASSTYTQTDSANMYSSTRNTITTSDLNDIKSDRTEVALTSVTQSGSYNPGTGKDGSITVSSHTNINTTPLIANRTSTCTDASQKGDAVNYSITALTSTTAKVTPIPASGCLVPGDEVLLINLQGDYTSTVNTGNYETVEIESISNDVVTFKTAKTKYYGENNNDDTNIGTAYGTQRVMLQRVPNYTDVTINSGISFYPSAWNGARGGVIFFRATGSVNVNGGVNSGSTGYTAGAAATVSLAGGSGGEAFCGAGGAGDSTSNGGTGAAGGGSYYSGGYTGGSGYCGGGGGGATTGGTGSASAGGAGGGGNGYVGAGAGGGYGTAGAGGGGVATGGSGGTNRSGNGAAGANGAGGGGGGTYGTADLSKLYFGSGGGGGGLHGSYPPSGAGGKGGGIVYISANTINVSGSVESTGGGGTNGNASYGGGGGGGSGGSVRIEGNTLTLGTSKVTAPGGSGGTGAGVGGAGGSGRIAIYYASSYSGTTSPTANIASYPTYPYSVFVSDEIPTPNATELQKLSWTADLNSYGKVAFQTRSGKSNNATDGTWEAWKPAVADTNIKTLESADTHTNWVSGSAPNDVTVADGGVARNVNEYEDEDEATTGNMTKLSSVGTASGYAEATINSTNISSYDYLSAWVYSTSSGNVVRLGFGEAAGSEQYEDVTIDATNTWQKVYWDLSDVAWDSRNAVTKLRVTLTSTNNTVYIDNIKAEKLMTTSSGTQISSTPNDYIQYRMILSTTNNVYRPRAYNIKVEWNNGYKVVQTDANTVRLYNQSGSVQEMRLDAVVFGADLAEYYAVNDQSVEAADLVAVTGDLDDYGVPILRKSSSVNDSGLIGIISTKAGQALGIESEDRRLLALAGRVPAKVATSSAAIKYGDPITSSAEPGHAKKASLGEKSVGTALESWDPASGNDSVMVLVGNSSFLTPTLSDLNAYILNAKVNAEGISYQITDSFGETINNIGVFSQMLAANIKAGAIDTKDLTAEAFTSFQGTVDNLLVKSGLVAGNIQTKLISPLADNTDITVRIGSEATPSGQFAIQNSIGETVASIDESGNATFSGTLYADNIQSKSLEDIQALLTQVTTDQSILLAATGSADLNATGSANIAELITNDMYVTGQATLNSASIADSLTLGSDLVFGLGGNTINSLSTPLKIQSLAMAPVEIMGGLITIDTQGNMQIAGNLKVAGRIESSGLTLKDNPEATNSANLLALQDSAGTQVAGVNASGSANFNSISASQFVIAAGVDATNSAIINGTITTNATAGSAQVPAGVNEIIIKNPKVTDYTLVYVTPTSSTENNVLYVKSKESGQFVVGFTSPINVDVKFNWWIVQVQN